MQGFPGNVQTSTTAQQSNMPIIRLDLEFIRTPPGLVKIVEIALNLLGFIFVLFSIVNHNNFCEWFNTVAMTGFWATGILLVFYIYHIVEKFHKIPWSKIEFIYCAIMTILYLIVSILLSRLIPSSSALGVATFFGFCAMCVYGFDAWMNFKLYKTGESSQGDAPKSSPSHANSPTTY